jgi:spore germination cell wall hydrolase CwlJ-like protein
MNIRSLTAWAVLSMTVFLNPAHAEGTRYLFNTQTARLTVINTENLNRVQKADLICMSLNVYHEARGTILANQRAVALVVRNRMRLRDMSACEIIYEGTRHSKQFSWTAHRHTRPLDRDCWDQAQQIAWQTLHDPNLVDITNGATHFHESRIRPDWSRRASHRKVIGAHTFLRLDSYYPRAQTFAQAR